MADNKEAVTNGLFPFGDKNPLGDNFTGQSYLKMLVQEEGVPEGAANVSFEPGARTFWHAHINGGYQMIFAIAGEGWYQEEGKPARKLLPGDVAVAKDGVKHWHGAAKDSWFNHLVVTAGDADWLEPVSDEHYKALEG